MIGTIIEVILAIAALSGITGVVLSHIQWKEKFKLQTQEFETSKLNIEKDIMMVKKGMNDYKEAVNKLTGSLYKVLYNIKADRCLVVQPHPIDDSKYLVAQFEVVDKGISTTISMFGRLEITKYWSLYNDLKNNEFIFFRHTGDISNSNTKNIITANGAEMLAAYRILDNGGRYLGSVVCEWLDDDELDLPQVRRDMGMCAGDIQFFLPPIED